MENPSALSLLFDLDGTLVNTDLLHFHAFRTLLADYGQPLTRETYMTRIMGATNDAIMREFFPTLSAEKHGELAHRKESLFRSTIENLEPMAGLLKLLGWAEAEGCKMAVVTNAPRPNAELLLQGIGLDKRLRELVIGEELARGKPDPLPYLTGLARINGQAAYALAFEDSLSGIRSAVAAGIQTFGLRTALPDAALFEAGASHVISDFNDPVLWGVLSALITHKKPAEQRA